MRFDHEKKQPSPEYRAWSDMKRRCLNPKHHAYKNYGGRGIKVAKRWLSFSNFIADMGMRPAANYSLDRIDNDGNYQPGNCRWTTRKVQLRNRRGNVLFTLNGRTQCSVDWATELGLAPISLSLRLKRGWPLERALTTPARKYTIRMRSC